MQPITSLDRFCTSLKELGPISGMSMDETRENFNRLAEIRQELSSEKEENIRVALEAKEANLINRIVTSCLPYSLRLAKDYARGHDTDLLMDLIAEGNLGLCRAINKYNPATNVPFRMYAAFWIKAGFLVCLKAHRKLVRSNKGEATTIYTDDAACSLPDTHATEQTEDDLLRSAARYNVEKAVQCLSPMDQVIFRLRTGILGLTLAPFTSVARLFGCRGTAFCKFSYQTSFDRIQDALRSGSTTSDTSCELSPVQA